MVKKNLPVIIDDEAKKALKEACNYIKKNSPLNAEKVKNAILASIKILPINPQTHNPDKFCTQNDGSFRAYEIYSLRITYHVSQKEIRVIRIRHTKMNPIQY
jgi:plasmid stabilization system protein ParE